MPINESNTENTTAFRPDFNRQNPYENAPQEYFDAEDRAFVPTPENSTPPSRTTPEGQKARADAPRVSEELRKIDLSTAEGVEKFNKLPDTLQFDVAVKNKLIPAGSEFVSAKRFDYSNLPAEQVAIEEAKGRVNTRWGYLPPEVVKERDKQQKEAQEKAVRDTKLRQKDIETARKSIAKINAQIQKDFDKRLNDLPEDLRNAYKKGGPAGYTRALSENYVAIAGGERIRREDAEAIQAQSSYGYNILTEQGIEAYEAAIEKALKDMAPYKRGESYRVRYATGYAVPIESAELLFDKKIVDKYWRRNQPKTPATEETTVKKSNIPGAAAVPVIGAIALAEPTPVGEAILAVVAVGALAYIALNGKATVADLKALFKKETGRQPTQGELRTLETATIEAAKASPITAAKIPKLEEEFKPAKIEPFRETIKATDIGPAAEEFKPAHIEPIKETMRGESMPVSSMLKGTSYGNIEALGIVASSAAVVDAEKDIRVIIKAKDAWVKEWEGIMAAPSVTNLAKLDQAVQEAYQNGEIDSDTFKSYQTARQNYIAKKAALSEAAKTYIGGIQPSLARQINPAGYVGIGEALKDLQQAATGAAVKAYEKTLAHNGTEVQAQQAAKTAARNAIREGTQEAVKQATRTQSQTKAQTKAATKAATQTATRTAIKEATATMTATAARTAARTARAAKLKLPGGGKDAVSEKVFPAGTVAWHQGIGWWVIMPPYTEPSDRVFSLTKPRGAVITSDVRTAAATIQTYGGTVPKSVKMDMGIMDVDISSPPDKPSASSGHSAIKFARDPHFTFRHKVKQSASQKIGPYYYKGGMVSRKRL